MLFIGRNKHISSGMLKVCVANFENLLLQYKGMQAKLWVVYGTCNKVMTKSCVCFPHEKIPNLFLKKWCFL